MQVCFCCEVLYLLPVNLLLRRLSLSFVSLDGP